MRHTASFLQTFHTGMTEAQRYAGETKPEPVKTATVRNKPAGTRTGRGVTRRISDKQAAFIVKLLSQKDITNLVILPGQTINPIEIPNMGVKGGTALIDKLLNCPNKATNDSVKVINQGSEKQRNFLASLMGQRNLSESDVECYGTISKAITALLAMPKATQTTIIEKGGYTDGTRIFNVYKARAGSHLLVKEYDNGEWTYVGSVNKLPAGTRKMTLEESKVFGQVSFQCCQCATALTDPESQAKGIGPICEGRM
jgi:hypothetical protein